MTAPVQAVTQPLRDVLASIIRTVVPGVAGSLLAWLASRGLDLTQYENAVNLYLVPACIAAYYTAVRLAEQRWPLAGLLLGWRATPRYITPEGEAISPPVIPPQPLAGGHVRRSGVTTPESTPRVPADDSEARRPDHYPGRGGW